MRVPAILQRRKRKSNEPKLTLEQFKLRTPALFAPNNQSVPNIQSVLTKLGKERHVLLIKPSSAYVSAEQQASSRRLLLPKPASKAAPSPKLARPAAEQSSSARPKSAHQCDSCDECFDTQSALIIHKTERSIVRTRAALREPVTKYSCDMCSRQFSVKSQFLRHYKNCGVLELESLPGASRKRRPRSGSESKPAKDSETGEELPAPCDRCDKVFKKQKYLRVHKSLAHSEHIACQLCELKLTSTAALKNHMSDKHTGDYTEFCSICHKGFYLRQSLKVHMAAHERDNHPCVCKLCGKSFRHDVYLRKHVQAVHVEMRERKKHQCQECGYETHYKSCFREHMYKHTGEDQVDCDICGKRMRSGYFKIHTRIHTGEKPEICEFCGKAFTARKYLKKHLITHTGEKPYQCEICGKSYTQRGTLVMHFRKHHPEQTAATKWQIAAALKAKTAEEARKRLKSEEDEALAHEALADEAIVQMVSVEEDDEIVEEYEALDEDEVLKNPEEHAHEEGEIVVEEGEITIEEMEVLQEDLETEEIRSRHEDEAMGGKILEGEIVASNVVIIRSGDVKRENIANIGKTLDL